MVIQFLERLLRFRVAIYACLLFICTIVSGLLLDQPITRNLAFRSAFINALIQPVNIIEAMDSLEELRIHDCRINWQVSLLAIRLEDPPDLDVTFEKMLSCSSSAVDWLHILVPERADLANRAAEHYPERARVWLWKGDLAKSSNDLLLADQYFTEATRLDAYYGLAWCRLGRVKEDLELLAESHLAYIYCCQNGDPGSHGCYGAGRIAEKQGDIPGAIMYYRRSHWFKALQRADELEISR